MQGTWSSILPFSVFRLGAPAWLPATPGNGARGGKDLDTEDRERRKEAEKKSLLGSQPAVIVTAKFHFNLQIIMSQETPNYKILIKLKQK